MKNIQLQGYNFLNAKPGKKAGGVAVNLSMKSNFTQLKSFQLYGTESISLKIWNNNSTKTILIGSIYRHPTEDSNKFLDDFSDCMEKLADKKKRFYIIGDINIDINRTNQNSPQADRYMQVITSAGHRKFFFKSAVRKSETEFQFS